MKLNIISPGKTIFTGECKLLQVPGINGGFEVLDRHAPIIALLGKGTIKVQDTDNKETFFDIGSGMLQVNRNKAVILVNE